MKKISKKFYYTILVGLILLILLFGITHLPFFRSWLVSTLVGELNKQINGNVSVTRIDGTIWSNLSLEEIYLTQASDTLATLQSLKVSYSPWRLVYKEIAVDTIQIDGISLNLRQDEEDKWNMSKLVKDKHDTSSSDRGSPGRFPFAIMNKKITIRNMTIDINSTYGGLPKRIDHLNLDAQLKYNGDNQLLYLAHLSFESMGPDFSLDTLAFNVTREKDKISIKDFKIKTRYNQVHGDIKHEKSRSEITLQSESVKFSEFNFFLPSIDIAAIPDISFNAKSRGDSLEMAISCAMEDQDFQIRFFIDNYNALLNNQSGEHYQYQLTAMYHHLNLQDWVASIPYPMEITGSISALGSDNPFATGTLNAEIDFINSQFNRTEFDSLQINLNTDNKKLLGDGYVVGAFGRGRFDLEMILGEANHHFNTLISFDRLNLQNIFKKSYLNSDLNLLLSAEGDIKQWQVIDTKVVLDCWNSRLNKFFIDSLNADIKLSNEMFTLFNLRYLSTLGTMTVQGEGDFKHNNRFNFTMDVKDLSSLNTFINVDTLRSRGLVTGEFSGGLESFVVEAKLALGNVHLNSSSTDSLSGNCSFTYRARQLSGSGDLTLLGVNSSGVDVERVDFTGQFVPGLIGAHIRGTQSDSIHFNLKANYAYQDLKRADISNMEIHLPDNVLRNASDTIRVVLEESKLYFEDFHIESQINTSDMVSSITVEGFLSLDTIQDFRCRIVNIDIEYLSRFFDLPLLIDGQATAEIKLVGTGQNPEIEVSIEISDAVVDRFSIKNIESSVVYTDQKLSANTSIYIDSESHLVCEALIPIDLALNKADNKFNVSGDSRLRCYTAGIPLSVLKYNGVKGTFVCDVTVNDLFGGPEYSGMVQVNDGNIHLPEYGLNYDKIKMHLKAEENRIDLQELQMETGGGEVSARGFVEFGENLPIEITTMDIKIDANKFIPLQNKDFELLVSGSPWVKIVDGVPEYGGRLDVSRLILNIPALTNRDQNSKELNLPLLLSLLPDQADSLQEIKGEKKNHIERLVDLFVEDLQGTLKIYIPRNFWIVSPGMRIELFGDLDVAKTGSEFELFGEIKTLRGHYDLLARRFNVEEGSVNFQGGEKIDPILNINAVYTFRTADKEKKSLRLSITDKLSQLIFNYKLDDLVIDETEAVAYLLFGQNMSSSSSGQQGVVADQTNIIAMNMASQLVSQQLAQSLGDPLALDHIEIKAQDNWRSASFVVGKYLTNDLYLSYERNFGETGDSDTVPEVVTMEYELTRRLFLQLMAGSEKVSGFDIIFKLER